VLSGRAQAGCDLLSVVTPEEMEQVRPRLEAFAARMMGGWRGRISGPRASCMCAG